MFMADFSTSIKDALLPKGGRRKYHDLYKEQLAERAAEHKILTEAFQDTVKSMNGFAQLASQQVRQITALSQQIADMKAPEENGDTSEKVEVKSE